MGSLFLSPHQPDGQDDQGGNDGKDGVQEQLGFPDLCLAHGDIAVIAAMRADISAVFQRLLALGTADSIVVF